MCFRKTDGSYWPSAVTILPLLDDNCPQLLFYEEHENCPSPHALEDALEDSWKGNEAPTTLSLSLSLSSSTMISNRKNARVTPLEELIHQRDAQNIEPNGQCALHLACRTHSPPEIIQVFLEADMSDSNRKSKSSSALWSTDNDGNIPLMTAVQYGCPIETVKALIQAQPSTLNAVNLLGQTPLHLAVEYACQTVVSRTIPTAKSEDSPGNTAGTLVAPRGSHPDQVKHDTNALEIVRLISTKSPQLLENNAYDSTPLHSLIASDGPGQIETLRALLSMLFLDDDNQEDQDTRCKLFQYQCTRCQRRFDQMTPLNLACQPQYYHAELISMMIQVCDPITIIGHPNSDGIVPLQYMCDPFLHFESPISSPTVGKKSSSKTTARYSRREGTAKPGTMTAAALSSKKKATLRQYASALSFEDVNTLLLEMLQAVTNHKNRLNKDDKVTSIRTAVAFKQNKAQHALWTYLEQRHFDAAAFCSSSFTTTTTTTTTTSSNSESSLSSLIPATVLKQLPWPLNPKVVFGFTKIFPTNDLLHQPYHLPSRSLCGTMNVTHLAAINAIRSYYPRVVATTASSPFFDSPTTPLTTSITTTTTTYTTDMGCVDPDFACLYIYLLTDYLHYVSPTTTTTTTTAEDTKLSSSSPPSLKVATDIITTINIWQSQQISSTFSESTTTKRFSDYQSENNNIRCILRLVVHIMFATYYKHLGASIKEDDTFVKENNTCHATKISQETVSSSPSSSSLASFTHQVSEKFLLGKGIVGPSDMDTLGGVSFIDETAVKCSIIEFCDDKNEGQTLTKALLLPPNIMTLDLFQMVFPTPPLKSILSCLENAILYRQYWCQKRHTTRDSPAIASSSPTTIYPWNTSIVTWVLTLATQAVTCGSAKQQDRLQYQTQISTLLRLLASDGKPTKSTCKSDDTKATANDKAELFHILEDFEKHFYNEVDCEYESSDDEDDMNDLDNQSQEEEEEERPVDPKVPSEHDDIEDTVQVSISHVDEGESSDEHAMSDQTVGSQKTEEYEGQVDHNMLSENDSTEDDMKVSAAHIEREVKANAQTPVFATPSVAIPVPTETPSLVETKRITSSSSPTVPTTAATGTADSPLSQQGSRPSRNCQSCSAALEPKWCFCPFCGTADSCRDCGTQICLGWRFCPCCGLQT